MAKPNTKQSYTIPCSSAFRDEIIERARHLGVNAADLVRSVFLTIPRVRIESFPDPGPPAKDDREEVMVKSGTAKGRPWRRKPRLQVRMVPGLEISFLRRALALALALGTGEVNFVLKGMADASPSEIPGDFPGDAEELARLRAIVSVLSFEPLPGGVKTPAQALHVLGLAPDARTDLGILKARFRMLAAIHHPDSGYGSHERMSQLNGAMDVLSREV